MRTTIGVLILSCGLAGHASGQCNPVLLGSYPIPQAHSLRMVGSTAYVTGGLGLFYLIDVSNPSSPTLIGSVDPSSQQARVDVAGDLALLAGGYSVEIECVDLSNPAAPTIIGVLDTPEAHWSGNDAMILGDLAYVAASNSTAPPHGIRIVDISNRTQPVVIGTVFTPGDAKRMQRRGNLLYLADGGSSWQSGLRIYDISSPTAPAFVGQVITPGLALDVKVVGDYAYVTDYGQGLHIIDVSDPSAPVRVGGMQFTHFTYGLAVSRGVAYISNWSNGLRVVDVSDPEAPVLIRTLTAPDAPFDAEVVGDVLYVAWRLSGLRIYDISSCGVRPCNPADFSEPYGVLDLSDITAFVSSFGSQSPPADLNGDGLWDLSDIVVFMAGFMDGCS